MAQVVPPSSDAGSVARRFETAPQPKALPRIGGIQLPSTAPPANATSIKLSVARFVITGGTVYATDAFADLTAPLVGKTVPLTEIYALAARITARYGQDGYVLSRAIVPPQSLSPTGAVVRIEIVEGYVDEVIWPEGLKTRYRDYFTSYEQAITQSRPANIKIVERYLLLASDLPGLALSSTFRASERNPKASTLVVSVKAKPISAEASVDNRGSKGRGPWQASVAGSLNNILGWHESIGVKLATAMPATEQLRYFEGSWRQVLNSEGLTFAFSGSYNTGIPGLGALRAIDYQSEGLLLNASLAYPLIRSRDQNLTVSGIVFVEDVKSTALGVPFTDDRLRGLRGRVDYDRADSLGGINLLQGTVSQGIDGLGSTRNDNPIPSRGVGRVDFTKVEGTVSRTQPLASVLPGLSIYASAYGQFAFDPLLVVEQCAYGGKTFGRAFDPSVLTGDNCVIGLAELRYDLQIPSNMLSRTQLFGFIDYGFLERKVTSAGTPSSQHASSVGGGLRLGWNQNIFATGEVARSIGGDIDLGWRAHMELTVRY